MSDWENKKERKEPKKPPKPKGKPFLDEDESRVGMRAAPSLLQSSALNSLLLAGTSTDVLKQRKETWTSPSTSRRCDHESRCVAVTESLATGPVKRCSLQLSQA